MEKIFNLVAIKIGTVEQDITITKIIGVYKSYELAKEEMKTINSYIKDGLDYELFEIFEMSTDFDKLDILEFGIITEARK